MGFFGRISGADKYGHAQNALIAKYTYEQLPEDNKMLVEKTACKLLQAGGYPMSEPNFSTIGFRPDDRYCLYSMAMASVGIEPALKGILYNNDWYPMTNPFTALLNADKQIMAAKYEIKKKCNIDIEL